MATWRLAIGSRSTDAVTIDAALADGPGFGKLVFSSALPASVQVGEITNDVSGNDHLIVSIENTREVARAFELDSVAAGIGAATIGRAYSDLTSAEAEALWVVQFNVEDLDVGGGFDCLRARIADIGAAAQLGDILYLLLDPVYPGVSPASAIVD